VRVIADPLAAARIRLSEHGRALAPLKLIVLVVQPGGLMAAFNNAA